MKISWLLLTYNRANSVAKALPHCMLNAGRQWDEMIWVDNGSAIHDRKAIEIVLSAQAAPLTKVFLPENLGVAKGYNRAKVLATGTHMVITGCDMLMPDNWLAKMAEGFEKIPKTGIVTIYASPISATPERVRGEAKTENGLRIQPAMPMGRKMISRELFKAAGYLREDFGMYGWEDVEWAYRVERVAKEKGLRYYTLPDMTAEHLGTEGNVGYDHKDEHEYWRWKKEQVNDPAKQKVMDECRKKNFPFYSPFC